MDKQKALVVDDEESVCEAVRAILELEGLDVTSTVSSPDAVEMVRQNGYDLIISDLKAPVMDGIQFYDKVREIENESVFIIVTAFGTIPSAVEAVKKGVYDYIPKPFTPDDVRIPVRRALMMDAPILKVGNGASVMGQKTDTEGRFWMFDARQLSPDTEYELSLTAADGKNLCDPWRLKTFRHPDSNPKRVRLLIYTCLGGHDVHIEWMKTGPQPLSIRQRLLRRALAFKPDAVISTGDQIYYDLSFDRPAKVMGGSPRSEYHVGVFDRSKAALGTENEPVLKRASDRSPASTGRCCGPIPPSSCWMTTTISRMTRLWRRTSSTSAS